MIPNSIARHKGLGFAAKGVLLMMLSHLTGWTLDMERLITFAGEDEVIGSPNLRLSLKQLEKQGYLRRVYLRQTGRIVGIDFHWYDHPVPEAKRTSTRKKKTPTDFKSTENQSTEFQSTEVQPTDFQSAIESKGRLPIKNTKVEEDLSLEGRRLREGVVGNSKARPSWKDGLADDDIPF